MRKRILSLFSFCMCMPCLLQASLVDELRIPREIDCNELNAPLPTDGIVSSGGWEKIGWSGNFTIMGSLWVSAPVQSSVKLASDGQYLYIGMKMQEPDTANLKDRGKFSMWSNDVAEFFLWKKNEKNRWLHLAVDCSGKVYFAREENIPEMPGSNRSAELSNDGILSSVRIGTDFWSVTAALPLGKIKAYFGDGSRVNFGRGRRVPYSFSSWAKTDRYQEMDNAGILRFNAKEAVEKNEARYAEALKKFQTERTALIREFKKQIYAHKYAFSAGQDIPNYHPLDTAYSKESGFGWLNTEGIRRDGLAEAIARNPGYAKRLEKKISGPLADNYIYAESPLSHTFRIDLPNGKYKVHLLSGLITRELESQRRLFTVSAQGREVQKFDVGHELYLRYDFPVEVKDGKLLLTFSGDPKALADNPSSLPLSKGDARKFYKPGWLINSIVVTPSVDRKPASKQIAVDELEITHCAPLTLGNYQRVKFEDKEPSAYPKDCLRRGYALFTRPFGTHLYPESRPAENEFIRKFSVRAVAGEPIFLNFGFLPLKDLENVEIKVEGLNLDVEETRYVSWLLGGGKYGLVPLFNDNYANCDHDFNAGENRWFWLTGRVAENARPGIQKGQLVITSRASKNTFPIEVDVLPFRVKRADFAFGGINPLGYNRPGCVWEDKLAALCGKYELNMQSLYVDPFRGESSWKQLEDRIRLYQKNGVKGPFIVYVYLPIEKVDTPLREHKIERIPDEVMKVMLDSAGRLLKMHQGQGMPELIFSAMDEAHCKGDPYWAEQVRLIKTVKEKYPELKTSGTESDESIPRIRKWMDAPVVFEVDDFNLYKDFKSLYTYTNQYLLEPNDIDAGRMQCGWIPAMTPVKGVCPWLLFEGTGESGFRYSIWTMLQQRGVGGYHYMPKLVTLMGTVGIWDLNYVETLRAMIAEAKKSRNPKRIEAAKEAEEMLESIRESVKPSIKYYYHNGYWKPEVFCQLREMVTQQILNLKKLEK